MGNHSEQLSEDEKSREIKNKEQREAHYNLFKTGAEVIKEAMLRAGIESDCTYFRYIYAVVSHFIQNDIEQNKWRASNSKGDFQETLRWEIDRIDRIVDTVSFESDKRSEKDKTAFFWFRCDGIFNYELARFMTKLSSKKKQTGLCRPWHL